MNNPTIIGNATLQAKDIENLQGKYDIAIDILQKIADMPRKTREQRLAKSCVTFLESLE